MGADEQIVDMQKRVMVSMFLNMWKGYLQFVARQCAPVDLESDLRPCAILFFLTMQKMAT